MKKLTFLLSLTCSLYVVLGSFEPARGQTTSQQWPTSKLAQLNNVEFKTEGKQIKVLLDGKHFTTFDYENFDKPVLYPIHGPGQIGMTRNWPMRDDVQGESHDHPHHKSMWISHEISGVDFWSEKGGTVKTVRVETEFTGSPKNVLQATSFWTSKKDGKKMLVDRTVYRFGGDDQTRWIDCTITYDAACQDLTFEDTKEGLFAIRTHPDLRLEPNPKNGVKEVFGKAINSEGVTGKAVWGKPAKWMLYQGPIDGTPMSIAMYDHPDNFRHPTTWHAREYGLVTANPFGLHHFQGKAKGAGEYKLKEGESLTLRYRVEFLSGLVTADATELRYQEFADTPVVELLELLGQD